MTQSPGIDSKAAFLWFSHLCLVNMQWCVHAWMFAGVCVCGLCCCDSVWCLWWHTIHLYADFIVWVLLAGLLIAWIVHPRTDEWMTVRGYCELW